MQIRKLNSNTYDVFGDIGFDLWSRVKRFHWGIKVIAGEPLARPLLREVHIAIEKNPHGSVENV